MALAGVNMAVILDLVEDALVNASRPRAIQMIIDFASGKDGKLGTSDDRMTPATVEMLKKMIEDGSIDRLVEKMHKTGMIEKICTCCGV
ncbi:hypothetical protein PBCVNEJV1_683R [Paramecium bursaria Chlorella virus NE-JV-1]|nr:hypothetical protein PBCVNEJV1_683R [Paramecium bursaria Chlorella virus NE-JV-1]